MSRVLVNSAAISTPIRNDVFATSGFLTAMDCEKTSLSVCSRQSNLVLSISLGTGTATAIRSAVTSPMGMDTRGPRIALGTASGVRIYHAIGSRDDGCSLFSLVASHYTGPLSVHDVSLGLLGETMFVNTVFSAVCLTSAQSHFTVHWCPPFAPFPAPVDACHLNGFSVLEGTLAAVTALAPTDKPQGWRHAGPDAGVLVDIQASECFSGLSLPHSPRHEDGALWVLEAGRGSLLRTAGHGGRLEQVGAFPGVVRGMHVGQRYVFVGSSPVRSSSGVVAELLRARLQLTPEPRIYALDKLSGRIAGYLALPWIEEISSLHSGPAGGLCLLDVEIEARPAAFIFDQ